MQYVDFNNNLFFCVIAQWVASIDVTENAAASANVVVKLSDSFTQQSEEVSPCLSVY